MMSIEETTISWHRVQSSEDIHYESVSTEEFHQLNLNYSVTGPLEIAVTFSGAREKTSTIEYTGELCLYFLCGTLREIASTAVEGVLTNISFSSANRTLIILSRDCIASPENYTLVVTFISTQDKSVTVPFNSTVVLDVGDVLIPNTMYYISVELVETTSGVVIDEMNTTVTIQEPGYS